jgi:hypothetical protein
MIDQKQFETWLAALPADREFRYQEGYPDAQVGCPIVNFLRDNGIKFESVTGNWIWIKQPTVHDSESQRVKIPEWLSDVVVNVRNAEQLREQYAKSIWTEVAPA